MSKTVEKARNAGNGQFTKTEEAIKNPGTTVIEKIKVGPVKHRN